MVKSDPHATFAEKTAKEHDLEAAEDMLEELVDDIEGLPPASRQQLAILFSEMKVLGMLVVCLCKGSPLTPVLV